MVSIMPEWIILILKLINKKGNNMGWRLSYYKCPKERIEKYKNYTDEDIKNNEGWITDNLEMMFYDITNWLYFKEFETIDDDNVWSRLFNNKLEIEDDISLMTINKEQLFNIIRLIQRHILNKRNKINVEEFDKEYGTNLNDKEESKTYQNARKIILDNELKETFFKILYDVTDSEFVKLLNDNPYSVSMTSDWESVMANFAYVYKTFDWENNVILVYGG